MTIEPKKRTEILKAIKKLVLAHHINVGGVDYAAWTGRVDERTPELLNADLPAFEAGIRQLLTESLLLAEKMTVPSESRTFHSVRSR